MFPRKVIESEIDFIEAELRYTRKITYRIKFGVSPLIKILDSSEAQPRNQYNVLINGVDRVL